MVNIEKIITLPYIGSIEEHNVYFYFEHINTDEIFNNYNNYAEYQKDKRNFNIQTFGFIDEGLSPFHDVIKNYNNGIFDVYVASVSSKSQKVEGFKFEQDIEMIVSIMMKKDYPISTHMGISRNKYYTTKYYKNILNNPELKNENIHNFDELNSKIIETENQIKNHLTKKGIEYKSLLSLLEMLNNYKNKCINKYKKHENLSIYLHLFAIMCSKHINDKLRYMYTKPAYSMFRILYNYFSKKENLIDDKKIIYFGDSASYKYYQDKTESEEFIEIHNDEHHYNGAIFDSKFPFDSNIEGVEKIKGSKGLYGSIKWKLNETGEIIDYPPWVNDTLVPKATLISIIIDVEQFIKFNEKEKFFDVISDSGKRKSNRKSKKKTKSKRKTKIKKKKNHKKIQFWYLNLKNIL